MTQASLENVPDIVRAVCLQTTLLNMKAELDQMAEGLKLFNVISLLRQHPLKFKSFFIFDVDSVLTVDQMVALFDVAYSPQGSSKRVSEEATFMHWDEFLHDLVSIAYRNRPLHRLLCGYRPLRYRPSRKYRYLSHCLPV